MTPKTPNSTISREKLWQNLSLAWYSRRAVLIDPHRMSRELVDAFVAPCYSRNRAFRGFWWLIQRIYCNIRVPPEKNGFIKCAWGRNNWTSREWGFRSCHSLRSSSSVRRVWWCQIVAQNQRHIHIHRHSRFPVCYPRKGLLYFVIADSLGFKWSVSPAFFFSRVCKEHLAPFMFAQTLDLQRCSLNTSRFFSSDDWSSV